MRTLAEENYLKAIYNLSQNETGATASKLSEKLKVKLPTINSMVNKLADKELVEYQKYKGFILTDKGKKQAKLTGHYLYDIFGKFDQVYSSPATRCVQTGNIINKQIKYKNKLIIDNLLVEIGFDSNKLDGLSFNEQKEVFDNIDDLKTISEL